MRLKSWLVNLCGRLNPSYQAVRRPQRLSVAAPAEIELLESRRMLSAQTITVNLAGDTHVAGHTTLRDAITTANSTNAVDTIVFAANVTGTITLTQGPLTIAKSMTIAGPGSAILTISGNNTLRLFDVTTSVSSNVTISGLTLSQGNSSTSSVNAGLGGAIDSSGALTLFNDVFTDNSANDGGAIVSTGVLTTTHDTFSGNFATSYGGAVFNSGRLTSTADTFTGNSATNGGAIENLNSLTITHDSFTANFAKAQGGALDNEGTAVSSGDTFSANSAVNPQAGGAGAGIYSTHALTSTNDTFFNNTAWNGGGIFSGNATLVTANDTVADNTGKGIVVEAGTWFSVNSIVAGNTAAPGSSTPSDVINGGCTITASSTLIGDANSAGGIAGGINGNIVGSSISSIFVIDGQGMPLLANNGGLTKTISLLAGSPAVGDAGALTTLVASFAASSAPTTIAVANSALVSVGDLLRIDNELVLVTSIVDGMHVVVQRAQNGTLAAPHLASSAIHLADDATGAVRVNYDRGALAEVNHAPVGTSSTVSTSENHAYVLKTSDFGFSDPNDTPSNTLLAVKITTLSTQGTLTDGSVVVTAGQLVSAADVSSGKVVFTPKPNVSGGPFVLCNFQVEDNGGTANGGQNLDRSARLLSINITHINHVPSGTSAILTTVKNTPYKLKASDFGFTDLNDSPPTTLLAVKITVPVSGGALTDNGVAVTAGQFISLADINAGKLVYKPQTNAVGGPFFVCTFQVEDNGGTANGRMNLDPIPKTLSMKITRR